MIFAPGMRVRVSGAPINTTLASSFGRVVMVEEWGTVIVHPGAPAMFHNDDGTTRQLDNIRILALDLAPIVWR